MRSRRSRPNRCKISSPNQIHLFLLFFSLWLSFPAHFSIKRKSPLTYTKNSSTIDRISYPYSLVLVTLIFLPDLMFPALQHFAETPSLTVCTFMDTYAVAQFSGTRNPLNRTPLQLACVLLFPIFRCSPLLCSWYSSSCSWIRRANCSYQFSYFAHAC